VTEEQMVIHVRSSFNVIFKLGLKICLVNLTPYEIVCPTTSLHFNLPSTCKVSHT